MRRRLFNLAAAMSAAACCAMALLWAFDYDIDVSPTWRDLPAQFGQERPPITRPRYAAVIGPNRLELQRFTPPGALQWPDDYRETQLRAGFGYYRSALGGTFRRGSSHGQFADKLSIFVPLWFALLVTAVLPLWWVARTLVLRRRLSRGMCASCGYDLRATPGRCPECGTVARGQEPPHNPPMQRTATASSGAVR
jgi:hypothetical protein